MVLLILVDGVGAGAADPAVNPLAARPGLLSHFLDRPARPLPHGGRVRLIDARLGVEGRPQSATGHAALLTGRNAPAHVGQHLTGFPNAALVALIEADNLLSRLARRGRRLAFLNAYHRAWLEAVGLPHRPPTAVAEPPLEIPRRLARPSGTTVAARSAGLRFHTFDDVAGGRALYHDFTGRLARAQGVPIEPRSPAEAGRTLARAAEGHDLALYEYFLTDKAGHARDMAAAAAVVDGLNAFLLACLDTLDLDRHTVLVVSDHGNLEDLRTRSHTLAPVPFVGFGRGADVVDAARDLTDVLPAAESLTSP